MTTFISSKWGRVIAGGVVCVILTSSPALAAPAVGTRGEGAQGSLSAFLRAMFSDLLGYVYIGEWSSGAGGSPEEHGVSATGVLGEDDGGPIEGASHHGTGPSGPSDDGGVDAQDGTGKGAGDGGPVGG